MNKLIKKIVINADLTLLTGLHIGDSKESTEIGGVDSPVVRRKDNFQPYIPGSSLKGKMRCLLEQTTGWFQDFKKDDKIISLFFGCSDNDKEIKKTEALVKTLKERNSQDLEEKQELEKQEKILKNKVWEGNQARIIVRDANMHEDAVAIFENSDFTDMPFTEVKFENVINRLTGTTLNTGLRQIERVPAGATFKVEFVINVFENEQDFLPTLLDGLELLESDYLGGSGSRGYGQVEFSNFKITEKIFEVDEANNTFKIIEKFEKVKDENGKEIQKTFSFQELKKIITNV